jgi:hypothetical protein
VSANGPKSYPFPILEVTEIRKFRRSRQTFADGSISPIQSIFGSNSDRCRRPTGHRKTWPSDKCTHPSWTKYEQILSERNPGLGPPVQRSLRGSKVYHTHQEADCRRCSSQSLLHHPRDR